MYAVRSRSVSARRPRRVLRGRYGRSAVRRIMPRMRTLSRFPASLYGGRGATELKSVDSSLLTRQLTTNGVTGVVELLMVPPVNGAAFYNRIGTRTRAMSLQITGAIRPTYTNPAAKLAGLGRIMIIYDRQPNGSLPNAGSDVIADFPYNGVPVTNAMSGLNMNNRDRFLVLRDRKVKLPAIGINGAAPASSPNEFIDCAQDGGFVFKEYIKLKGLESHYKASSGNVGDIATGSFIILCSSTADAAVGTDAAWEFGYCARLKFYD